MTARRLLFLMAAQVAASGFQVCAAACSGVSCGGLFVGETQRGSIWPSAHRVAGRL